MTDEFGGPGPNRLDPLDPRPPEWAHVRAVDVVRRVFEFEPGTGSMLRLRRKPTTPPVLRITDSYLTGTLDLRAVEFPYLLEFVRCRFECPPDIRQAKLAGCEFSECWLPGLEGRNLRSDNDVRLVDGTVVAGRLDLTDGDIHGSLELTGTGLYNQDGFALHADRLQLAGALLAATIEVHGQLRIPGLRTGGNINFAGATLHNPGGFALDGNGLHVGGNLHCVPDGEGQPFRSTGRLFLPSAVVDSDFSLRGAQLVAPGEGGDQANERFFDRAAALVADRIQVSGNLDIDQGMTSTGTLRLVNARIGGSLRLAASTIDLSDGTEPFAEHLTGAPLPGPYADRALHMDGTEIGGGIDAHQAKIAGQVRLVDVKVSGSVVLDGATLSNRNGDVVQGRRFTTGGNLDARGVLVFGSVQLHQVNIGANLDLRASRFVNPGRYRRDRLLKPSVDLRVARIGRDLVCAKGERTNEPFSCQGEILVRRAEIGRETNFYGAQIGSNLSGLAINAFGLITQELRLQVATPPRGRVNLRHARCATLADNDTFWDATGHIELDDFRYDALAVPIDLNDKEQVKRRLELLRKAMGGRYRPGPYDQFAAMLRAGGNEGHAAKVLIAKQRWRYTALADSYRMPFPGLLLWPRVQLWSLLQRATVGYGYRPILALLSLVLLLVFGTTVFSFPPLPSESNVDDNLVWNPFLYTVDHLIPIADFGHQNRWYVNGWRQWVSAVLVAFGWILATTVAAGVTRMLRRTST